MQHNVQKLATACFAGAVVLATSMNASAYTYSAGDSKLGFEFALNSTESHSTNAEEVKALANETGSLKVKLAGKTATVVSASATAESRVEWTKGQQRYYYMGLQSWVKFLGNTTTTTVKENCETNTHCATAKKTVVDADLIKGEFKGSYAGIPLTAKGRVKGSLALVADAKSKSWFTSSLNVDMNSTAKVGVEGSARGELYGGVGFIISVGAKTKITLFKVETSVNTASKATMPTTGNTITFKYRRWIPITISGLGGSVYAVGCVDLLFTEKCLDLFKIGSWSGFSRTSPLQDTGWLTQSKAAF